MTKLAEKRPPFCACCFQHPEGRSVDFEAAYDGPVIPGTPEPIPVDDLIICESCLAEAFVLLDPQNLRETIDELKKIVLEQQEEIVAKDKMIQGAESTISELVKHPIKPAPGKPPLVGLSDEDREAITKGRFARRGTTSDPTQKKKAKVAA